MIPLWLKIGYTIFAGGILVVYFFKYGPQNYLWFSDIALIAVVPALWLESGLIASMMTVGVLLPEITWNVSFITGLLTGRPVTGLADYMFESDRPLYLRAISLFHVVLPVLLVWLVWTLGYDPRALAAQTALAWVVLPITYWLTGPELNINWVYCLPTRPQTRFTPLQYLGLVMVAFPVVVYLPTHILLLAVFRF